VSERKVRCPICGSSNVIVHRESIPRRSKLKKYKGKCMQTIWYRCLDCRYKFYVEREVEDFRCRKWSGGYE